MVPSFEIMSIQKSLSSSKLVQDEQRSLCLVSLTVTSLYASTSQFKQLNYWHDIVGQRPGGSATVTTSSSLNNMSSSSSLNNIAGSGAAMSPDSTSAPTAANNTYGYPQILELTAYPDLQMHLLKVSY